MPRFGSFRPTSSALDTAAELARILAADFDREATKRLAERLHQTYFDQLVALLPESLREFSFTPGALRLVNAYAKLDDEGTPAIWFDEQWDYWLFTATLLNAIAATKVLESTELERLRALFAQNLRIIFNPYGHEHLRELIRPLMFDHPDCLEVSHALSRAMTVFTILHEIGHIALGHLRQDTSFAHEFEADEWACRHFIQVVEAGGNAGIVFVHEKLSAAPLLLMSYIHHFEMERAGRGSSLSRTHPPALERRDCLVHVLKDWAEGPGAYVLSGFEAGLADLGEVNQ